MLAELLAQPSYLRQMFLDYVQDRLVDEEQATGIRWRSEMSNMMRSLRECKEMLEEGS